MEFPIQTLENTHAEYPTLLAEIPDAPKTLYLRGALPERNTKILAVVGARDYTDYGKQVTESCISRLRGLNIAIVSGLALGIDSLAHRTALNTNLPTLAIPGSGINDDALYPARHRSLARDILEAGGGLLSEYEPEFRATRWSFPRRNRIMAGIAHATLVIEATQKSGTLITSRLAVDYNRDVLTVPGNIFSDTSAGPHLLLTLGATPVTSGDDIAEALGLSMVEQVAEGPTSAVGTPEAAVLMLLREPKERDEVIRALDLDTVAANTLLMQMEITGTIVDRGGVLYKN